MASRAGPVWSVPTHLLSWATEGRSDFTCARPLACVNTWRDEKKKKISRYLAVFEHVPIRLAER